VLLALTASVPIAHPAPTTLAALDPKVIAYYPATGGWTTMWKHWDPARYRADFARIAALDANTVRIFVPVDLFGFPSPGEPYVGRLRQLVGIAAAQHLGVQLTLFDWFHPGGYGDVAGSEQWAKALLAPYAGDPRVSFVEVRNEIDPDDPLAVAWARQLIPFVRSVLGGTPLTISVTGSDQVGGLRTLKAGLVGAEPDFYSLHYYGGSGEQAYWELQAAKAVVAPQPLFFGETGYPTSTRVSGYSDLPLTRQAQEAAQAHFLKTVAYAALELGLPPPGIWTLDDFDPGGIPNAPQAPKNEAEYHFGLFRTDGSPKPAAAVVRRIFGSVPSIGFDEGFEQAVPARGGGSLPAEWSAYGGPNAQLRLVDEQPRDGTGDAVVRSLGGRADGTFFVAPIASTPPPGTVSVDASVWVRIRSHGARVHLALEWLDGTDAPLATQESPLPAPGPGWKQLQLSGAPPDGARSVRIELVVGNSPGSVWFDDVGFGWTTDTALTTPVPG
jgi:hypothetical protein